MTPVDSLRDLAKQGAWHTVAARAQQPPPSASPALQLSYAAYQILALTKLQQYGAAYEALRGLGDLDTPQTAPLVPFALRWLRADLPARLGMVADAIDALYRLLQHCKAQLAAVSQADVSVETSETSPDPAGEATSAQQDMWRRRQQMTVFALITHHVRTGDYAAAATWLEWALKERGPDPDLHSRLALVHLLMGDTRAAAAAFKTASASLTEDPASVDSTALVRRNRGLLFFAERDYKGAAAEFQGVLEARPTDVAAANNLAVCRLYLCDLPGAVMGIEAAVKADPGSHLREVVLANLCSMYQLSSSDAMAAEARSQLGAWAAQMGPQDLDLSCIKQSAVG